MTGTVRVIANGRGTSNGERCRFGRMHTWTQARVGDDGHRMPEHFWCHVCGRREVDE